MEKTSIDRIYHMATGASVAFGLCGSAWAWPCLVVMIVMVLIEKAQASKENG